MKNRFFSIVLTIIMLFSMAISASALTAQNLSAPTPGGDHIFNPDRMMQFIPDTRFHSGIVNGGIINPGTGAYSTYAGVKFDIDTYKGEKCVKVELLEDKVTGYFDFNYYQWNADVYEPSLDAPKYPWLRVRYAYNEEAEDIDCMAFLASKDIEELGGQTKNALKTWDIANGEGEWMDTVVYLGDLIFDDGSGWFETTIRQFRVQMFEYNENPAAVCYIAGFGFFETEEAAKGYNFATGTSTTPSTPVVTEPVTEAPTQAPVTEAPTQAPVTEAPTKAPATEADTTVADTTVADTEVDATVEADTTAVEADTTAEGADSEDESADTADVDASEDESADASDVDASKDETTSEKDEQTEAPAEDETTTTPTVDDTKEDSNNLPLIIGIIAAILVIAAIVVVVLKKKKD